jgi:BCD family chlorophyll transporter-like MFS transporter
VLGQDVLLEPYSAQLYDLPVSISTRLNSITGTFTLISLVVGSLLERKVSNPIQARIGAWMGVAAFGMILISGFMHSTMAFYVALAVLGLATGLITVSNLALMLDMTVAERVGMFMGVWGMANAASRLAGNLISGALRDGLSQLTGNLVFGYQAVFGIELIMLLVSLYLLRSIDVARFRDQAEKQFSYIEKAAMAGDA